MVDGKRTFTYASFKTRPEAELHKAQVIAGVLGSGPAPAPEASRLTVRAYASAWIDERQALGIVASQSALQYRGSFRLHVFPEIGDLPLADVTTAVVKAALASMAKRLNPRTLSVTRARLSALFNTAVADGLIPRNPVQRIKLQRFTASAGRLMTLEERKVLAKVCRTHRLGPVIRLAVATGLRRGELAGLRWRDVDFDAGKITVSEVLKATPEGTQRGAPKTDSGRRTIAVPEPMLYELAKLKEARLSEAQWRSKDVGELPVFTTEAGSAWPPGSLGNAVKELLKRCGLGDYSIHDLRHLHASALLQAKHNLKAVSVRLGHSDPRVTMSVYAHLLPNDDDALATTAGTILGD